MLQKVYKNSVILKYLACNLLRRKYMQPYLQMIYEVWPMLSTGSIRMNEARNRQLSRLIHNLFPINRVESSTLPPSFHRQ